MTERAGSVAHDMTGLMRWSFTENFTGRATDVERNLAMIDNRTNEQLSGNTGQFTEAQVEAAADAAGRVLYPHWDEWEEHDDMAKAHGELMRVATRAALVAAQGAAPQAEPDPYRVVRVLHEHQRDTSVVSRVKCVCGVTCEDRASHRLHQAELIAHLEAAPVLPSSTAPHAEAYVHCCNHPKCPGGSLCCCASEQRLRDCWNQWREEIAGDSKQAFRDGYQAGRNDPAPWLTAPVLPSSTVDESNSPTLAVIARAREFDLSVGMTAAAHMADAAIGASGLRVDLAAPVLPSSGVDEDALAEVIGKARTTSVRDSDGVKSVVMESNEHIARAVAEWLKGQGR